MSQTTTPTLLVQAQTREPASNADELSAARGDVDSFIRLYRAHVRLIYRYVLARTGNAQDAEDVTAQVFERAWQSIRRYKPQGTFKSWLFAIAQHTLADHYRRRRTAAAPLHELSETLLDSSATPEDGALLSEEMRQVVHLISELPQEQQEILELRFLGDLSYAEIATVTGKGESAVKMMAYRALEDIRKRGRDVSKK